MNAMKRGQGTLLLCAVSLLALSTATWGQALQGDVTGDGVVDAKDALRVYQIVEGVVEATEDDLLLGDVFPLRGGGERPFGDDQLTREDAVRILRSCRRALAPGGRVLVVEQLASPAAVLPDLHMLVLFGEARQRSPEEFAELFRRAGLALVRVIPTASDASVVEAAAAGGP